MPFKNQPFKATLAAAIRSSVRKTFKTILKVVAVVIVLIALWNYKLVLYGIGQLGGQLKIVLNAVPVEEALADTALSAEYRQKLMFIEEVRNFAFESLGLKFSKNYTTFYDQKNKPILWVVTACPPFEMKAYTWNFPILGDVSYKGFFRKKSAEKEASLVRLQGYEAEINTVSGWSTLGWFKDPVLSGMLKKKEGAIAELIIHELTHSTVYLKSNVDLNENLATFIGERGAEKFLTLKFGLDSRELKEYFALLEDERLYSRHILFGAGRLDSLYKSFDKKNLSLSEKNRYKYKYKLIAEIMLQSNQLDLQDKKIYKFNFRKEPLPGNPYFKSFMRYNEKQDDFEKEFTEKFNSDLRKFIAYYANLQ